jgi:tRNA threonylcarbamoyladenosine biosynthesis protein TsaB
LNLLALDTSTEFCTVALRCGDRLLVREEHAGQRHSERVLPMIESLLNDAGLQPVDLDAVAFGAGPGSFTGLRIACGVAQGLAFALDIPVAPVGTLEALAEQAGSPRVVACLDARMGEIYLAAYEHRADDWHAAIAPCLCGPDAAPLPMGDGWVGCGSGFDRYPDALERRFAGAIGDVRVGLFPHAREIARIGVRRFAAGLCVPAEEATPLYIRDKVALKTNERP